MMPHTSTVRYQLVAERLFLVAMCLQVELYVPFLGWDFGRSPANQFTVALVQFLEVVNLQDFSVVALAQLQDSGNQVFAFVFPWV